MRLREGYGQHVWNDACRPSPSPEHLGMPPDRTDYGIPIFPKMTKPTARQTSKDSTTDAPDRARSGTFHPPNASKCAPFCTALTLVLPLFSPCFIPDLVRAI